MVKALLVGGGGREHALAWKLAESSQIDELHAAPGNPGIAAHAELHDVPASDIGGLADLAVRLKPGVVVIGPENPLADGLADELAERGIRAFGPSKSGARLESSKLYAKKLMARAGIPTAPAKGFTDIDEASEYIQRLGFNKPMVIKADGLAGGKGVTVARFVPEAIKALVENMQEDRFGAAGRTILVEEYMEGEELSILAFCDGKTVLPLPAAQDYKRAFDRDKGSNTGGMGSYSPVPACTEEVFEEAVNTVLQPCADALEASGEHYVGVIYAGLMLTENGLKVVEFNCRFGDPETQAILPRLKSDLGELILASTEKSLPGLSVDTSDQACVCVVAASKGYPDEEPQTGFEIQGLDAAAEMEDVLVFHAGTKSDGGRIVNVGGRVLGVTGLGDDIAAARDRAYAAIEEIKFQGMCFRSDIAKGK